MASAPIGSNKNRRRKIKRRRRRRRIEDNFFKHNHGWKIVNYTLTHFGRYMFFGFNNVIIHLLFLKIFVVIKRRLDCYCFSLKKHKHFHHFVRHSSRRQTFHVCSLKPVLLFLMDHYTHTKKTTLTGEDYSTIFSETLFLSLRNWKLFDEKQADLFFQVRRRAQNSVNGRAGKKMKEKENLYFSTKETSDWRRERQMAYNRELCCWSSTKLKDTSSKWNAGEDKRGSIWKVRRKNVIKRLPIVICSPGLDSRFFFAGWMYSTSFLRYTFISQYVYCVDDYIRDICKY